MQFTATVTGSTAAVTWNLTGPGSLSTTTGSTTSYTPPATATSPASATLAASVAGVSASVAITVNPALPSITISPAAATLTAGGSNQTFTATLTNLTGTVNWSISPAVGTLSTTSGASTVYTPTGAASVVLTAAVGTVSATAAITVNPPATITVSGTVLGENGLPADNCAVAIASRPVAITDAQGKFSISNVSTPYDLVVANTNAKAVVVYRKLTLAAPYVYFWGLNPGTLQTAGTLSGVLNNAVPVNLAAPFPRPTNAVVTFGAMSPAAWGVVAAGPTTPAPFSMAGIDWYGSVTATTGSLHALQWNVNASGLPTGDFLYGTRANVSLASGGTLPNQDMTLTPQAASNITGTITLVPNMTLEMKNVWIDFPSGGYIGVVNHVDSSTSFSYTTPSMASSTATASVSAWASLVSGEVSYRYGQGLQTDVKNIVLEMHDPPVLSLPVDQGINIDHSTVFAWSRFLGGVKIVLFLSAPGNPQFAVFTMDDTTTIPDLAALGISGMDLPSTNPQTQYIWSVIGIGPFTTIDEAAGPGLWTPSGNNWYQGVSNDRSFSVR